MRMLNFIKCSWIVLLGIVVMESCSKAQAAEQEEQHVQLKQNFIKTDEEGDREVTHISFDMEWPNGNIGLQKAMIDSIADFYINDIDKNKLFTKVFEEKYFGTPSDTTNVANVFSEAFRAVYGKEIAGIGNSYDELYAYKEANNIGVIYAMYGHIAKIATNEDFISYRFDRLFEGGSAWATQHGFIYDLKKDKAVWNKDVMDFNYLNLYYQATCSIGDSEGESNTEQVLDVSLGTDNLYLRGSWGTGDLRTISFKDYPQLASAIKQPYQKYYTEFINSSNTEFDKRVESFLKDFYTKQIFGNSSDYAVIKNSCSANVLKRLKDAYEYDIEGEEAYAIEQFRTGAPESCSCNPTEPDKSYVKDIVTIGQGLYVVNYVDMNWIAATAIKVADVNGKLQIENYARLTQDENMKCIHNKNY